MPSEPPRDVLFHQANFGVDRARVKTGNAQRREAAPRVEHHLQSGQRLLWTGGRQLDTILDLVGAPITMHLVPPNSIPATSGRPSTMPVSSSARIAAFDKLKLACASVWWI